MLHQIQRWLTGGSRTAAAAEGLAGPRAAGLAVEPLEAREVLAGEPVGTEFQINTFTNSPQQTFNESPGAVASDSNGNYVVVWASDLQDGSGFGVYGQRFNSSGVAQGAEFRVNSSTIGDQKWATVAMDSSGDFVVTWTSAGQDGGGYGVFAQRYNAAGVALGGEFQVNTTVASDQKWSTVAMDSTGNFVITWTAVGQDGFGQGVYAAQFTAAGVAVGGEFRVNTVTVGNQQRSAVAMDADGDYAIVWQSYGQDASSYGIFGQRYSKSNVPVGAEFQVNTTTTSQQIGPSIAMDS
ncbi:MAG TPA: hypothetical protein VGE52_12580, partial [Pirellulales bacterium]